MLALAGLTALVGLTAAPTEAAVAPRSAGVTAAHGSVGTPARATATPLTVTLTSLSPSTVPRKGVVTLAGVVTNDSTDDWSDVTLAPFVSRSPITTRDELALAASTEPTATVGERLLGEGLSASAGDLAPGTSRAFTLRVRRSQLGITGAPGVYWIGVHALGTGPSGRDSVADGRARTFIPLVRPGVQRTRSVPVTVLLPLRERARRASDGSLNGITRWEGLLASEGRLARLAGLAASAPTDSLTWVVDPAVLDAVEDVSKGNPALSLGPQRNQADPAGGAPDEATRGRATTALGQLVSSLGAQDELVLGYSDPDVGALLRDRASLLDRADAVSRRRLEARGLSGDPAVVPPDEVFDPRLVSRLDRSTTLVLGDEGRLTSPPTSRLRSGQELVLGDDRASAGGPGPGAPLTALALRQRVLSEAALEAEKGDEAPRPVTVVLPPRWDPGARWRDADFFGGLQTPWTRLVGLDRAPTTTYAGQVPWTAAARTEEVPAANVDATRALALTGFTLGHLLASRNDVTDSLVGAALQASSYSARPTPELAAQQVLDLDRAVRGKMDGVQVTGTDFSTLSGGSGIVTVSIVNGLRQPITVGLRAKPDSSDVKVAIPPAVTVQPGQRTTRRLDVSSTTGVHKVTVVPVTTRGEELGTPLTFSLRTSQVGKAIWVVMVAAGALLAVMIVRRIVLRVRLRRWRVREER